MLNIVCAFYTNRREVSQSYFKRNSLRTGLKNFVELYVFFAELCEINLLQINHQTKKAGAGRKGVTGVRIIEADFIKAYRKPS